MTDQRPSQFYTGLVVDLYEPLAAYRAKASDFVGFIERSGQPVLELGCGSGLPLIELLQLGYDVDGLDSSHEMLARCSARATELGLTTRLYEQEMQRMALPRRYRSILIAGPTLTLLTSDDDARATLAGMYEHLLPGGMVLIPLWIPNPDDVRKGVGRPREVETAEGSLLRFEVLAFQIDRERRSTCMQTRYQRIAPDGTLEQLDRELHGRFWDRDTFWSMLELAGFERVTATTSEGKVANATDSFLVFRAQRPA